MEKRQHGKKESSDAWNSPPIPVEFEPDILPPPIRYAGHSPYSIKPCTTDLGKLMPDVIHPAPKPIATGQMKLDIKE